LFFELLRLKIFEMPAAILDKLVPREGEASLGLCSSLSRPSLSRRGLLPKLDLVAYLDVFRLF
jgi:hypothetical protein